MLTLVPLWLRWVAVAALAAVSWGSGYAYRSHVQDVRDAQRVLAERKVEQGRTKAFAGIDTQLVGELNEARNRPPLAAAPDCVRERPDVRPAPAHPGEHPVRRPGPAEIPGLAEAIAHDADRYDTCYALFTAARAALIAERNAGHR